MLSGYMLQQQQGQPSTHATAATAAAAVAALVAAPALPAGVQPLECFTDSLGIQLHLDHRPWQRRNVGTVLCRHTHPCRGGCALLSPGALAQR